MCVRVCVCVRGVCSCICVLCVCACTCVFLCVYVCVCVCMFVCMCVYMHVCVCMCVHAYTCSYFFVCMCLCECVRVCMRVRVHVHVRELSQTNTFCIISVSIFIFFFFSLFVSVSLTFYLPVSVYFFVKLINRSNGKQNKKLLATYICWENCSCVGSWLFPIYIHKYVLNIYVYFDILHTCVYTYIHKNLLGELCVRQTHVHIDICKFTRKYVLIHGYTYICVNIHVHTNTYTYTYMGSWLYHTITFVCFCKWSRYMFTHMHMCIHEYLCITILMCIDIHIYTKPYTCKCIDTNKSMGPCL